MASVLFVLNDSPYGSERSYNALRHALAVAKLEGIQVRVFLTADATTCARPRVTTPSSACSRGSW
jgi:uncharacterized protein involved in oxidation of intracellular sulfur